MLLNKSSASSAVARSSDKLAAGLPRQSTRLQFNASRCICLASSSLGQQQPQPQQPAVMVKICGVTCAADAQHAVQQGADLIGMIMWPKAKRAVSDETAAAIAAAAKQGGVDAVGVFVDEDAATISRRCKQAGIRIAQLHGDNSRACINAIPTDLQVVYVLNADDSGCIRTPIPGTPGGPELQRDIEWLLVDGMSGGSGKTFDWSSLQVPRALAKRGWLLAGGLQPTNVAEAVATAQPTAVDVSSGVCGPDGLLKDREKVTAFVQAAKQL